jgi:hypothetical protein
MNKLSSAIRLNLLNKFKPKVFVSVYIVSWQKSTIFALGDTPVEGGRDDPEDA